MCGHLRFPKSSCGHTIICLMSRKGKTFKSSDSQYFSMEYAFLSLYKIWPIETYDLGFENPTFHTVCIF
jgi:hypothetical protein